MDPPPSQQWFGREANQSGVVSWAIIDVTTPDDASTTQTPDGQACPFPNDGVTSPVTATTHTHDDGDGMPATITRSDGTPAAGERRASAVLTARTSAWSDMIRSITAERDNRPPEAAATAVEGAAE